MAIICGCSPRMVAATARESIHFKDSTPFESRPMITVLITPSALSSPRASFSTVRTNSSLSPLKDVASPSDSVNWLITSSACWRDTVRSVAIAAPILCTSFGAICWSICAADCSPTPSRKTAAFSTPFSASVFSTILYPITHHASGSLWTLSGNILCQQYLLVIAGHPRRQLGRAARATLICSQL